MTKETEKQLDELWSTVTEQKKRIEELEKENAKRKSECITCVYTDSPCVRSDYPSKEGVCSHYKNVFEENVELKKLKRDCETSLCRAEYQYNYEQLTKAKEIIKDQKELLDRVLSGAETLSDFAQNTLHKAEQFLKEC